MTDYFIGKAEVFNESFYINTHTGEGLDRLMLKMKSCNNKLAKKFFFSDPSIEQEDLEQQIYVLFIEGARKYKPNRNAKLSTFIYDYAKKILINELEKQGYASRTPTTDNVSFYNYKCSCGYSDSIALRYKENANDYSCEACGLELSQSSIYKVGVAKKSFEHVDSLGCSIEKTISRNDHSLQLMYDHNDDEENAVTKKIDFDSVQIKNNTTRKIFMLVYKENISVTEAAKKVGLSPSHAYNLIKRLGKNKIIQDYSDA